MKTLIFIILGLIPFFLSACSNSKDPAYMKEMCKEKGLVYMKKNLLNYRTGEYELKGICVHKLVSMN